MIAPKSGGRGSSINGGELLFAALATCFCNDLYREAAQRGINVDDVNVKVTGTFGNPGEPAHDISSRVQGRNEVQSQTFQTLRTDAGDITALFFGEEIQAERGPQG